MPKTKQKAKPVTMWAAFRLFKDGRSRMIPESISALRIGAFNWCAYGCAFGEIFYNKTWTVRKVRVEEV